MALHSYKQGEFGDNLVERQRNGFSGSEFLDSRWSGVGAHMGDHELEEGEACEPDLSCDPDADFSYLDQKIFMVLGDVQKCFEGGVSAEKLGSKFGGYGSFLPTQERAPSILHQDKPASVGASDAYCRTKKSSSEGIVERVKRNTTGSSIQANNLKAGSSSAVLTHENGGRDSGPVIEKTSNVDGSFPAGRIEENISLPKKVTLRIKMGSETNEKKRNATIYSDFGLSNSSSEAEDEFMDEDRRTDSDPESSPDRTPLTMIRIMTSHHIPDGMLLSPLPDLVAEPFMQKERVWSTCPEDLTEKARSPGLKVGLFKDGDTFDKVDIPREKTKEHPGERKGDSAMSSERAPKRVKVEKDRGSSKDSSRHVSKPPSKAHGKDMSKVNEVERQARDAVSESGTGVRSHDSLKDYKGFSLDRAPLDYPFYEADHIPKDFCSPFQSQKEVDSGRELQSRGYRTEKVASSSHDSANEHLVVGHQGRDAGKDVFNTLDTNLHGKQHLDVSSKPLDGKRRTSIKGFLVPGEGKTNLSQEGRLSTSKGIGAGKIMISATDVPGRELAERPTECGQEADVSRGSSKEKGKDSFKEVHRSSMKDKYLKTSSAADLVADETPKDGPQYPSKTAAHKDYKEFQQVELPKLSKTEGVEHKRKEKSKERVTSDYINKEASKVSEERQRELATRDVPMKVSQPAFVSEAVCTDKPSQSGALPPPPAENAPPPYIVVMDNWVQCDKCEKWRLLPPGVEDESLPQKWRCKMLHWLEKESLNKCSVPEETTDQATRAIYNIAAPIPPPVQENPAAVAQVPPPVSVVTSLPPPSVVPSQETKAPEKIKGTINKKRKIPSTVSSETIVPGKSKSFADQAQATQDAGQGKLSGGDTIATQEKVQAKVGGPDLGPVKTGEVKKKVKEGEKARRHRPSDGGSGSSPSGKKHNQTPANLAIQEAIKLKHKGDDLLKSPNKQGQERAGTALYLQAALKFLQAASMQESEGSEHGDHPVKLYAGTAGLCDYCASIYDRNKDLAAAALAYKCVGVARMRVVQAKSSLISKCRVEVQNARQVAPGESPSSSMPVDTDALRNSATDRTLTRGAASPATNAHSGGSLIIAAKCRASFNQILEYVADTSTAVDALTKAQNAFAAAESSSAYTVDGMSALRKVLDFSFHDVGSFVRLVRIALEAMGH